MNPGLFLLSGAEVRGAGLRGRARRAYECLTQINERRDGTVESIADGTEEFSFTFLNNAVAGDGGRARFYQRVFDARDGVGEAIKGGIHVGEVAFRERQEHEGRVL